MKKIDKLILKSFIGPFVLTFFVVVFILLTRHMLMYFDDIIGKGLGWVIIAQLLFYFAIFMIPMAMPLAVLLSSLMTFGSLGEHFELTAIKSAGISLLRILVPIFFFVIFLTGIAFYANNYLVPKAALEAYTLIFDIKQKKPAMDIREGVFYSEIPGISIKVNRKFTDDDKALKEIILYEHGPNDINTQVTVADSGRMASVLNDRYLKFELFNGYKYTEGVSDDDITGQKVFAGPTLTRASFTRTEVVYDVSSFELSHTSKNLFEGDRLTRNLHELDSDIDSINKMIRVHRHYSDRSTFFTYRIQNDSLKIAEDPTLKLKGQSLDTIINTKPSLELAQAATNMARQGKSKLQNANSKLDEYRNQRTVFEIQWHRIWANSIACIAMFLIGAPLGAIIKRGGLGLPFLVSIAFFVTYYLLGIQGGKLAQHQILPVTVGVWLPNCILLVIGLAFLRQAQIDTRIFESDFYHVVVDRMKRQLLSKSN